MLPCVSLGVSTGFFRIIKMGFMNLYNATMTRLLKFNMEEKKYGETDFPYSLFVA